MGTKGALAAAALASLIVVTLARGLPAETFFVGDPGVKLIAARHAIAAPSAPLTMPLPSIGGERVPYVEPFFFVHGDHSHAVTSEIFPIASAPFIALFGIRGAYVLPAIGFMLAIGGCVAIGRTLDGRRPAVGLLLAAALGTPLLFYGLEFWEHAPAAGAAAIATALWLRNRPLTAGLLFGIAILLRPEAVCYAIAVVVASRLLASPPTTSAMGLAAAGAVVPILPLEIYSLSHFHSALPPHISSHTALMTGNWLATRAAVARHWFFPQAFAVPDWWGVALAIAALSGILIPSNRHGRAFLIVVVAVDVGLIVLTAPNDGGGQWGPRYLLLAYLPAAVLLADATAALSRTDLGPTLRQRVSLGGSLIIVALIVAGAWAQRDGYRRLRTTKQIYGRVLDFVRSEAPAGTTVVTDLWWLDQVAASTTEDRQFLFVAEGTRDMALRALEKSGVPRVTVFRSAEESPADDDAWMVATCYERRGATAIPERGLAATWLELRPGCT
jgi:hypothetical protein